MEYEWDEADDRWHEAKKTMIDKVNALQGTTPAAPRVLLSEVIKIIGETNV
jgi:hypothetical protein